MTQQTANNAIVSAMGGPLVPLIGEDGSPLADDVGMA